MNTTLLIGGGLAGLALLIFFVLWIIAIVKSFKAGQTGWGIANILVGYGLINTIYFFIKGHKGLGMLGVLCLVGYLGAVGFLSVSAAKDPELLKQLEALQKGAAVAPAQ